MSQIKPFVDYIEELITEEIINSIRFINEKAESVWWYNGNFVTFRSNNTIKLLQLMTTLPYITVREIANSLNINKSAVQKQIKTLQDKEYIMRVGGKKGHWHVAIVCTTLKGGTKK